MIRKTALLTGVAAILFAAPVMAQDLTNPIGAATDVAADVTAGAQVDTPVAQTDVQADAQADVQAEAQAEAQAEGSVSPGAQVRASDGTTALGILEGATVDASGAQALAVRTEDGSLKTVPMAGASLQAGAVVTAWTEAEFEAAPSVAAASADASATATAQPTPEPAPATDPMAVPESMTSPEPSTAPEPMTEPEATEPQ